MQKTLAEWREYARCISTLLSLSLSHPQGTKYLEEGIFCKFATDLHGFYVSAFLDILLLYRSFTVSQGGDSFAMKAASHELNGLRAYLAADVKDLHTPLMILVVAYSHGSLGSHLFDCLAGLPRMESDLHVPFASAPKLHLLRE